MLKRIISILLALSMVFTITACGGKGKNYFDGVKTYSYDKLPVESTDKFKFDEDTYTKIDKQLVNKNANATTKNIFSFLCSIYGKRMLTGQVCGTNEIYEVEAIYKETGKYPALRGFDFIFCSKGSNWLTTQEVDRTLEWAQKGGLVAYSWHWWSPNGQSFYTNETQFNLGNAVTDLNIATKSLGEIEKLWKDGKISEECYLLVRDIDDISAHLKTFQENDITVLWRPLHEASGGWFWWGAYGKDAYLWLYKLMFERQTYYHKLNNLIWVWNGQHPDWYPGDEYCDIVGMDIYASAHDYSSQYGQFKYLLDMTGGKKLAVLSENGVLVDPDKMLRDNIYWGYQATWYGSFLLKPDNTTITEDYTSLEMLNKVYSSDLYLTLDELPSFRD